MQPTQVEIQECCSKTNLCSFEQGRCDPANRNADCQGNLICETNTNICGKYVLQRNGMNDGMCQLVDDFVFQSSLNFANLN